MEAAVRLQFRAERVVAAAGGPALELIDELADLGQAAIALVAVGLVDGGEAEALLMDTADALVVRGVDWLQPTVPSLPDLAALYEAATAPPVETASLRALPASRSAVDGAAYLERLVWQQLGAVAAAGGSFDTMVTARRRVAAAVSALAAEESLVLDAFDGALVAAGWLEGEGEVPAGLRVPAVGPSGGSGAGGYWFAAVEGRVGEVGVLALEGRGASWAVLVSDPPARALWSAEDASGRVYGGAAEPDADGAVRFDPALPDDWRAVTLSFIAGGEAVSWVVDRP